MTILSVGASTKYSDNWAKAFGAAPAKKTAKQKAALAKKKAPKKSRKKKSRKKKS